MLWMVQKCTISIHTVARWRGNNMNTQMISASFYQISYQHQYRMLGAIYYISVFVTFNR